MEIKTYLHLIRPANNLTAISDVVAGMCIAGLGMAHYSIPTVGVICLILSTIGLYSGGIVYNDICDAQLDAIERPERPIPSGKISLSSAHRFVGLLFFLGILSAWVHHWQSGLIALFIAGCAIIYDRWGKHQNWFGPINMGLCRGLNLLLGISILPEQILPYLPIMIVPILYIAAITILGRGEVHGQPKKLIWLSIFLFFIVQLSQIYLAFHFQTLPVAIGFVILHGMIIYLPIGQLIQNPIPQNFGKAVKWGILGLIVMNATWAATANFLIISILLLLLLPISIRLAKIFAVT